MEGGPSIQEAENSVESTEEDKNPGCDIGLCDPRRPLHRFIALIFMCLLGFGKFYKQKNANKTLTLQLFF